MHENHFLEAHDQIPLDISRLNRCRRVRDWAFGISSAAVFAGLWEADQASLLAESSRAVVIAAALGGASGAILQRYFQLNLAKDEALLTRQTNDKFDQIVAHDNSIDERLPPECEPDC